MRNLPARSKHVLRAALAALAVGAVANAVFASEIPYDRVIHLQGTTNTRDIGGYQTADHRTLRRGQIIRSENLSRLTAEDFQKLEKLGVKTVIDLRTDRERDKSPTVWLGDQPPQFHHFPIGDAKNEWFKAQRKLMKKHAFTEEQSLEHMKDGYRMIAEEGTASYQNLMALVLDEANWPILIHCNAGKDRSGVAVMLIMEALGVDRETIMEEYLLTNEVGRSEEKAALLSKKLNESRGTRAGRRGPSASAWLPIVGVHAEMLDSFYASVEEEYGSMDVFLTELGVDREAREALRAALTAGPT